MIVDLLVYLSVGGVFLNYYYFLKCLVMIEFILISVLMLVIWMGSGKFHCVIYIVILGVCESIIILLVVVMIIRIWGSDLFILTDFM